MRLLNLATCNLNQWARDFDSNLNNIKESITMAKQSGAVLRLGPELEITGYDCEDHFLELNTVADAFVDSMALHLMLSVQNLVNRDLEEEIVNQLMGSQGGSPGSIQRMLEESPSAMKKRERLSKSIKLLKESKEVVAQIMDRITVDD